MDLNITIFDILVLVVSIILYVSSFVLLHRWRRSVFCSTNAYLRNLRYIQPGEKVCIQAPDAPGMQYKCSGKNSKTMVYWEYCYTVEGVQYCKSYFYKEGEEPLPSKVRIYYSRKNPKIMYREGTARDGVIISVVLIFLASLFMIPEIASIIEKMLK